MLNYCQSGELVDEKRSVGFGTLLTTRCYYSKGDNIRVDCNVPNPTYQNFRFYKNKGQVLKFLRRNSEGASIFFMRKTPNATFHK